MLQAIRRHRSRIAARKAKIRARWLEPDTPTRASGSIFEIPTLAQMPTREWFEAHSKTAFAVGHDEGREDRARLAQVARIDPYVADLRDGTVDIDHRVLHAIGVDADWFERTAVQQGLVAIRIEQQKVVAALAAEASRRPLDFSRHGRRFWPRDLEPVELARLDRWAADDGFQTDMLTIERVVRAAHKARDAQQSAPNVAQLAPTGSAPVKLLTPVPDGFGGMRDTPPPAYRFKAVAARIVPFEKGTERPGKSLLMLLRHCGEHPNSVALADDGRLMGLDGVPFLIDPLIHMWRHDDRVQALVVETVTASRTAGRAVWPQQHAAAIRALSPTTQPTRISPLDRELTPRR